jgi:phage/conjugal plasmid C-4 type zinc finger TraR family protein
MTTEKMMELSEQLTDAVRDEGLYKAQQALQGDECEDCGSVIPEARRKAMPNARRCVFCQQVFERFK